MTVGVGLACTAAPPPQRNARPPHYQRPTIRTRALCSTMLRSTMSRTLLSRSSACKPSTTISSLDSCLRMLVLGGGGGSDPCRARSCYSHQRRASSSSSSSSSSSKPSSPQQGAALEPERQKTNGKTSSRRPQSDGDRKLSSRLGRRKAKATGAATAATADVSGNDEAFRRLPSVPSTQHLHPAGQSGLSGLCAASCIKTWG